jgi:hypothetical protein
MAGKRAKPVLSLTEEAKTRLLVIAAGGYRGHAIRGYAAANFCSGQKHSLARLQAYLAAYRPRFAGDWNPRAADQTPPLADWMRERLAETPGFRN